MRRALAIMLLSLGSLLLTPSGAEAKIAVPYERADVNGDGVVNSRDLLNVALQSGPRADVDGNGRVNAADLGIVAYHIQNGRGRDKYRQPFSRTSPWNMPVGSLARFVPAHLPRTAYYHEDELPMLAQGAPLRAVVHTGEAEARCGAGGAVVGQYAIPDGYIVPGAQAGERPNRAGGVVDAAGTTVLEFQYASRCDGVGALEAGAIRCSHSIYGSGVGCFGGHGGSGLSGVGGSIRRWEVEEGAEIEHALKLTLPVSVLSACNGGYRWPALTADDGFSVPGVNQYTGTNCELRMGSLLALAPDEDCDGLVTAALARRVCRALQNYGAYVVDSHPNMAGWRPLTLNGEYGTAGAFYAISGQLLTLFERLQVVTNNGPGSVGGGGSPRVPLLPMINN